MTKNLDTGLFNAAAAISHRNGIAMLLICMAPVLAASLAFNCFERLVRIVA